MKINLIIPYYNVKDKYRYLELKSVFLQNLQNEKIDHIFVFFEKSDNFLFDYEFLKSSKTSILYINHWHEYAEMIEFANKHLVNEICIIANTDILFDNSIAGLNEINYHDKKIIALTRWQQIYDGSDEYRLTLNPGESNAVSFDSYIFRGPIECDLSILNIKFGYAGCDTLLVKRLQFDCLFEIIDPCLDIKSYHIDKSDRDRSIQLTNSYWKGLDYPWYNKSFEYKNKKILSEFAGIPISYLNESIINKPGDFTFTKMKKVIAFTLLDNTEITDDIEKISSIYPGWECWLYIANDKVSPQIINQLAKYHNVKTILIGEPKNLCEKLWRFLPMTQSSVKILISLDNNNCNNLVDNVSSIQEWIASGDLFYVNKNFFGVKHFPYINWEALLNNYPKKSGLNYDIDLINTLTNCSSHTTYLNIPWFKFYRQLDFKGNDISYHSDKSIKFLYETCKKTPNANGFNTLGFIKHDVDVTKLEESKYFGQSDGIFVLNTEDI